MTTLVVAPNWLGDAVMALPAIADIRRHAAEGRLVIAARRSVADLFAMVPGVDEVVPLERGRGWSAMGALRRNVLTIAHLGADLAILLPNSFQASLLVKRAGVPERWGYARDLRRLLLTKSAVRDGRSRHQADYYRHLVAGLGMTNGPGIPALEVPPAVREASRALLMRHGWDGTSALVGVAPGAAYGGAKRWPATRFARVCARLVSESGATCVLLGSHADSATTCEIALEAGKMMAEAGSVRNRVLELAGATTLRELAGVIASCRVFLSNDSGSMHLAAAVGVPVVAVFGSTDERVTSPLPIASGGEAAPARHAVLTSPAWCRPCMLRECPLDHECMTGVDVERVHREVASRL
jgi:heptosyltransferase-2